ncbi:MAG: hypothetical protein NZL93_05475, partial [Chthoniobacterales bacterium]|nr:hypothetical protein [Chthoniobacterales bacterium]
LSTLLSQLNRTQLYLRWLDAATTPLEEFLAQNPNLPESVIAQIHLAINLSTDEMARLLQLRTELLRQRQTLLAQRQALQIELNSNLQKNLHFLQKNALGSSTGA